MAASVTVTNTGPVAGKDVVQLYLTSRPGGLARRLLAFEKVSLAPGESRTVTLTADPRLLADFDTKKNAWTITPGSYRVGIGSDAGTMKVNGKAQLSALTWKP